MIYFKKVWVVNMGLISKLKSMFKKNIDCSDELNNTLVHFYVTPNRKVSIGSYIIVKQDYMAVLVCNDKVTDMLPAGKHKIDNTTIPQTFKHLKLYKINQSGKLATSFKCDFYFINLNTQTDFAFTSNIPFVRKKDALGKVVAYSEGLSTLVVEDPDKLVNYLIIDNAYVKDKKALTEVGLEIGNFVNKTLEKMDMSFEDILNSNQIIDAYINSKLNNVFDYMGISVKNVNVQSFSMPSKLQKRVESLCAVQSCKDQEYSQNSGISIALNEGIEIPMFLSKESQTVNEEQLTLESENVTMSETAAHKQCSYCGNQIKSSAKFCEHCGFKQI